MSHPSRAVSQSHVLSTSLPLSQPLHPVSRTRNQNSAHRRCPSSPLGSICSGVDRTYVPDCQTCHRESLFTASTHVPWQHELPRFQAREKANSALKFDSWRRQPRAPARYRAGGNTQCWNSATIARARQARICFTDSYFWVDQGVLFWGNLLQVESRLRYELAVLSWVATIILGRGIEKGLLLSFVVFPLLERKSVLSFCHCVFTIYHYLHIIFLACLSPAYTYTIPLRRFPGHTQPWTSSSQNEHGRHSLRRKRTGRRRPPHHPQWQWQRSPAIPQPFRRQRRPALHNHLPRPCLASPHSRRSHRRS